MVKEPGEWEFSSYLEYAGLRAGKIPQMEYVKGQIPEEVAYQQFLSDNNFPDSVGFKRLLLDE
ncbi:MAG: hypothetical protein QNJ47_16895 [Nostocaceae cyanobacterium]|nr:hypothetical protein [Nostocaceae cyanobacterium]